MAEQPSSSEERPHTRRHRGRASPFATLLLSVSVLALAAAIVFSATRGHDAPVFVVKHDIEAFRVLTDSDIGTATRRADEGYAELPLAGRLTIRPLKVGEPIRRDDVGPNLAKAVHGTPAIIGIPATHATVLGQTLHAGDLIHLLVDPKARSRPRVRAVVLKVSRDRGSSARPYALVVGLRRRDANAYGASIGRPGVVVLRDPMSRTE